MVENYPKFSQKIFTSTIAVFRKYPIPSCFAAAGLIFFVYGLISLSGLHTEDQIVFEDTKTSQNSVLGQTTQNTGSVIVVDVEGAVIKPGVYRLSGDARIKDALIAASGLSLDADRGFVAKTINLAQKLTDGAKVYVPSQNQNAKVKTQNYTEGSTISVDSQININTATASELDSLPGVGAVTAQKIIDNRPYADVQDLLKKKVVGNSVFEKIKDKITIY